MPCLIAGSVCIGAGNNGKLPPDKADLDKDEDTSEDIPYDLDHENEQNRIVGGTVDIGAYEKQ